MTPVVELGFGLLEEDLKEGGGASGKVEDAILGFAGGEGAILEQVIEMGLSGRFSGKAFRWVVVVVELLKRLRLGFGVRSPARVGSNREARDWAPME
ncbi:unnamed protein product [Camellia sinensis]